MAGRAVAAGGVTSARVASPKTSLSFEIPKCPVKICVAGSARSSDLHKGFARRPIVEGTSGDPRNRQAIIGSAQAQFQLEAVAELRRSLRNLGSDLVIRIGRPEQVLVEMVKKVGAAAVYCQTAVTAAELGVQKAVSKAVEGVGASLKAVWGSQTLLCPDKLPFQLHSMPTSFGAFSRQTQSVKVAAAGKGPGRMKGRPAGAAAIDPGKVPTLASLGLAPPRSIQFFGGEAQAVRQAAHVASRLAASAAAGRGCGTHLLPQAVCCPRSEMSPWLSAGCISARRLFDIVAPRLQDQEGKERMKRDLLYGDFYTFLARRKALQSESQLASSPAPSTSVSRSYSLLPDMQSQLVCA